MIIVPLCGSILQAETCKIFSLAELMRVKGSQLLMISGNKLGLSCAKLRRASLLREANTTFTVS